MGGPNLEIFKFALYIFTPVVTMLYFGTNLDQRFAVPDFWPRPEETHRIPFERAEIVAEMERLKRKRLWLREQRLRNTASVEGMRRGGDAGRVGEGGGDERGGGIGDGDRGGGGGIGDRR